MSDEEKKEEEPHVVSQEEPHGEESSAEEKNEKKEAKKKAKEELAKSATPKAIDVREYSKAILFYPLFIYSLIAWLIVNFTPKTVENLSGGGTVSLLPEPITGIVGIIWIILFFANLFVMAFNFPTAKFFMLFLILVVLILVVILLYIADIIHLTAVSGILDAVLKVSMNSTFYSTMTILLAIVMIFVILSARLKYVHIEENEVFIKHVMMGKEERYPTNSMKYSKEIPDVFEFLVLGAGSMTFTFGTNVVLTINTIPMVNRLANKIDLMGDFLQVRIGGKK